jgi:hypothetical protein
VTKNAFHLHSREDTPAQRGFVICNLVGESYAETPAGNYKLSLPSFSYTIIQQIIHKPTHTQNPVYGFIQINLNSFLFILVTQLHHIKTCIALMSYESFMTVKIMGSGLLLSENCGIMFLQNSGSHLQKKSILCHNQKDRNP